MSGRKAFRCEHRCISRHLDIDSSARGREGREEEVMIITGVKDLALGFNFEVSGRRVEVVDDPDADGVDDDADAGVADGGAVVVGVVDEVVVEGVEGIVVGLAESDACAVGAGVTGPGEEGAEPSCSDQSVGCVHTSTYLTCTSLHPLI